METDLLVGSMRSYVIRSIIPVLSGPLRLLRHCTAGRIPKIILVERTDRKRSKESYLAVVDSTHILLCEGVWGRRLTEAFLGSRPFKFRRINAVLWSIPAPLAGGAVV